MTILLIRHKKEKVLVEDHWIIPPHFHDEVIEFFGGSLLFIIFSEFLFYCIISFCAVSFCLLNIFVLK